MQEVFEVNNDSGDVLGASVQQSARSGRQQVTMSRHQSAGVCSNRSSCRIRSSRSKHRKVAWDIGEDAALRCLGFDTSPKVNFGKCRQGEYIRASLRKRHHSRRRTIPLHGTHDKSLQSIMKCYDETRRDLHVGAKGLRETARKRRDTCSG